MNKQILLVLSCFLFLLGCQSEGALADAYGNFEAREVMISPQIGGPFLFLNIQEGQRLEENQLVGLVDTIPLHLQAAQIRAKMRAIRQKTAQSQPQIDILLSQKANLEREQVRLKKLLEEEAAPSKQLDDINGQIEVIQKQIISTRDQIQTANRSILSELEPMEAQLQIIEDQIKRCRIINPTTGVVLQQLAEPEEMAAPGKPLYKLADLDRMILRAYVSGAHLPYLEIGQEVTVYVDESKNSNRRHTGIVRWVAEEAEFTPKIVQTKEERTNLVYAVKVEVPNDGSIKIGMPGELEFLPDSILMSQNR